MKAKKNSKTTTNRTEFNRSYKEHLNRKGKIRCSYCKYHRGENFTGKWYGGYFNERKNDFNVCYPSWKLASKNRKQWMKKPMTIREEKSIRYSNSNYYYIEIDFKRNNDRW